MLPEHWKNGNFMREALACGLGAVLIVAGAATALAGDDEEEDNLPDVQMMRSILKGFGLKRGDESAIEYRERSPLVVPPTRDLPPPESEIAVKSRNAAWPVDADEKRRKDALAVKRKASSIDESRALRPNEMMPGGTGATDAKGKAQDPASSGEVGANGAPM